MNLPGAALPQAAVSIGEALLMGFLVGAQREASQGEGHPGVRDFVLIALVGAVCGLLQNPWLTVAALISITALLVLFYLHTRERTGITTEMAAVATFCLGFVIATPQSPLAAPLAIGTAIAVVAFLEAKRSLHKLVRETITEAEFNDTLRFLALIFVIYPLLPEGAFGPYQFLEPRRIWLFVILVSSVSYAGYFVEKFMGARRGLKLVAVFGGLASTTAATTSFARSCKEEPGKQGLYGQASVIANAIQFPRILIILALVSPALAQAAAAPLAAMMAAGLLFGLLFLRGAAVEPPSPSAGLRNPFRLLPALKFGAIFTAILLVTKMAATLFGSDTIYWTSTLGGMLDVDAVSLSLAELLAQGRVTAAASLLSIFLALLMNAVVKTAIAAYGGTAAFAWRTASGFAVMFGAGAGAWLVMNLGTR